MASEEQKIAYLEEHVSYEVVMLNYTFMRLLSSRHSTPEEQLDGNAFLESFGVHARNLIDFLSEKSREVDQNASDYVPEFEVPDQARLQHPLDRLEKVLHATALRASDSRENFNTDDARELYAWIVPAILKFQGQLAPSYRVKLNALGPVENLVKGRDVE